MKKMLLMVILAVLFSNIWCLAQNEQIHVIVGWYNMPAHIGDQLSVPIQVYASEQYIDICNVDIAVATNNTCIASRYGGTVGLPFVFWDTGFNTPVPNTPTGYTSQSLVGFELSYPPDWPYNPHDGATVASFTMTVPNDPNLIGQTRSDVFAPGEDAIQGPTYFGDCDGTTFYHNIAFTNHPVTFLASYSIGTGTGVMNNQLNHIDSTTVPTLVE